MSTVYVTDLRTTPKRNLLDKVATLLNRLKIHTRIRKNDLVAVKLHFGERGNTAYVRPVFVRTIVDRIKEIGGKPWVYLLIPHDEVQLSFGFMYIVSAKA